MKYSDPRAVYFEIIKEGVRPAPARQLRLLRGGRECGIRRDYIDFVGDTVQAFRDAGLHYYNEAILITCVGSLPIRAGKQFSSGRKLGKTHQNVLVFVKGNGKKAADRCGTADVDESMFDGVEAVGGDEGLIARLNAGVYIAPYLRK